MSNPYRAFTAQTTPASLSASDALRGRFLRWMEVTKTPKREALARIGWHTSPPGWMSGGNIPEQWRLRIGRVMDATTDGADK